MLTHLTTAILEVSKGKKMNLSQDLQKQESETLRKDIAKELETEMKNIVNNVGVEEEDAEDNREGNCFSKFKYICGCIAVVYCCRVYSKI